MFEVIAEPLTDNWRVNTKRGKGNNMSNEIEKAKQYSKLAEKLRKRSHNSYGDIINFITLADAEIKSLQDRLDNILDEVRKSIYKYIQKDCSCKMKVEGNTECSLRRKIISGLDGCLCRCDNCNEVIRILKEIKGE